jgi:hypothetical protein
MSDETFSEAMKRMADAWLVDKEREAFYRATYHMLRALQSRPAPWWAWLVPFARRWWERRERARTVLHVCAAEAWGVAAIAIEAERQKAAEVKP